MIRFACPSCKSVLSASEDQGGTKLPCPRCGQRLMVPAIDRNKTVVGNFLPEDFGAGKRGTPVLAPAPVKLLDKAPEKEPDSAWYYTRGGKSIGPLATEQMHRLIAQKQ